MDDQFFLRQAILKASESVSAGGFPAGAVLVKNGEVLGGGISIGNKLNDPTSHGEVAAIRDACLRSKTTKLSGVTLYTSLQPCAMCLSAAMWSGIARIVYACSQEKVSEEYYGGRYSVQEINTTFSCPLEIQHISALEEESLMVVRGWEKRLS